MVDRYYIVRWRIKSMHFIDGMAFRRYPGDEDVVPASLAKRMQGSGQVHIIKPYVRDFNEPVKFG